jgi:hypothetical protein
LPASITLKALAQPASRVQWRAPVENVRAAVIARVGMKKLKEEKKIINISYLCGEEGIERTWKRNKRNTMIAYSTSAWISSME